MWYWPVRNGAVGQIGEQVLVPSMYSHEDESGALHSTVQTGESTHEYSVEHL